MPRHEFRTIEQFVQWLEKHRDACDNIAKDEPQASARCGWMGKALAFETVLDVVRTSNLGIVYPPSEDK